MSHDRYYLGGGNVAGVIGVSPFRTPLDEYHTIIGDAPEINAETERFFRRRKSLEPFAAEVLRQRGFVVVKQNERYTDSEFPFFKAELDAETVWAGGQANAEFKSVHPMAAAQWGHDGDPEGAPAYVTAQAQWGMGIKRDEQCEFCNIVAAIGFDDSRVFPLIAAADVIGYLRQRARMFWEEHVLKRVPPEPTTVGDILAWIAPDPRKIIEATDYVGLAHHVSAFLEARDHCKHAESALETAKAKVQMMMQEATTLTLEGRPALTWKPNKESLVTDYRALSETSLERLSRFDPEAPKVLMAHHTHPKPGARVFRVCGK